MNKYVKFALMFGLTAACCFAQQTSFGKAAQGLSTEIVATAKWIGISLTVFCGIGVMAGGTHMVSKIGGLLIGLAFALFASPIVSYIASLASQS
jgi:hypothetical protein